jgi:hypothetical protein
VIWIHSSTRLYQVWIRLTGRMMPRDNETRWNSWWLMIHVALKFRKEINNFVQDHRLEDEIKEDYLDPNDWQELIELHDFLLPFWEIIQGTQFDIQALIRLCQQWTSHTSILPPNLLYTKTAKISQWRTALWLVGSSLESTTK